MRAFSLVELIVVMGIIVLLVGGVAMALAGRGGEGTALTSAQKIVSGLVGTARAQAALHQTKARLVVYAQTPPGANADASKYLRSLIVLLEDPADSGRYVAVGDPVTLPAPICVVPPSPVPANHLRLPAGQTWNNNVAMGPVSTFEVATGFNYRGQSTAATGQFFGLSGQSGRIYFLDFLSDGSVMRPRTLPAGAPLKIAVATAVLNTNAPPQFNNNSGVRGLIIRERTGATSLVHTATGF